ncbi:MAG: histidine phosphatase family protein [Burkholderiales bacterium]|nr:histidine phosphatase family protein [Burkholderiales bacterium]
MGALVNAPEAIWAWRHPQPQGVAGRCIGRHDVALDRRKAKRLAHRIRQAARRHGLPHIVHTSSLRRCRWVGQQLRRWGWRHVIDERLLEASFGLWEGCAWSAISRDEFEAWMADFVGYRPGGGESLGEVLARAAAWMPLDAPEGSVESQGLVVVAHGGWMLARRWMAEHAQAPAGAHEWPASPAYGQCWLLR